MKKQTNFFLLLTLIFLIIGLVIVKRATAQAPTFDLTKTVLGSGGLGGNTGEITFRTTLGQPVAGMQTEGIYTLTSGFWSTVKQIIEQYRYLLPIIFKQ